MWEESRGLQRTLSFHRGPLEVCPSCVPAQGPKFGALERMPACAGGMERGSRGGRVSVEGGDGHVPGWGGGLGCRVSM